MPDGPRRSVRIAELSKKRRISKVKATESHPKRGRRTVKGTTGLVTPSRPSRDPQRKKSVIERLKTRGEKALKRPKDKLPDVERDVLSKNGSGTHRVTGKTAPQQARALERLAAKHLVPQHLPPTLTREAVRSPEFEADPQQRNAGTALSRDALRLLEAQTANNPLPEELSTFRRTPNGNEMPTAREPPSQPESTSRTTAYNKEFLIVLERHGILEQQYLAEQPVVPNNYQDILTAIGKERAHSPEPCPRDYMDYAEAVFNSQNEDSVKVDLMPSFFGMSLKLRDGHAKENSQPWTKGVAIAGENSDKVMKSKTNPDYAEGLKAAELPEWVYETVGASAAPGTGLMAFPNFLVELKRDLSMYTAHAQNRHRGAIASQAYHDYYEKVREMPDKSWAIAKVGSIEFNGDTVVGNLHWVDKTSKGRRYHMTRILCLFTCGLKFEDFKEARKRARNFRDYFSDVRDNLRDECKQLSGPSLDEGDERDPEASSTERPNSESAEAREDPTPEPRTRNTRSRGKRAQGNARKDPPGRKSKKRKNGNTEPASVLNKTDLSFGAEQLAV